MNGLPHQPHIGDDEAVRAWARNRRAVSAVEVRELTTEWGTSSQAFSAALALLGLYAQTNGWPPPQDPVDWREDLEVWDRFATLRARLGR